jgi:acyl carrier protein phosphodiesterase
MNYLGHAYLSFHEPQILIGNMISDFVKGKARFGYTVGIHDGIMLHRHIDTFTDNHPSIKKAKKIFHSDYRLYSGAIVDIVLDHFLARDNAIFTDASLLDFTLKVYAIIDPHIHQLPEKFQLLFPYMKRDNWLYHYKTKEGIGKSLQGMIRRAAYIHDPLPAITILNDQERFLEDCYLEFIEDVKSFAKGYLSQRSI